MAVALADLAVPVVDQVLDSVATGHVSTALLRVALRVEGAAARSTGRSRASPAPPTVPGAAQSASASSAATASSPGFHGGAGGLWVGGEAVAQRDQHRP